MKRILLIVALVLGLVQTADGLEITFKQDSSVEESVITLGDIAGFDEETEMTRALASQIVGQSPSPGKKISLTSLKIKEYLTTSQALPEGIHWSGSPTTTVMRHGLNIGPEKIQTLIADYLQKNRHNMPEAEIRFVPSSLPLPFTLPTGELSHQITPSNPAILGSSRFSIIFRIDGKVVKNMSVRGEIEALAEVMVAGKPLKRGDILRPQDLQQKIMDISSMSNPAFAPRDLIGKKLQRSLRAGSPILGSMVEALPLVQRGERVKIVIDSGRLHLTATGLAHSDGTLHEMIRVKNIKSNKTVYCRVAAPGLVEVMF